MNYYAQGGQAHGLSKLKEHPTQIKDGVPAFGIGGWYQKNIAQPTTNAVMGGVKAVQNLPGIKQVSDLSTEAFKPIDQALVGLDKSVAKAIPGGWGTIAQTVAAMVPGAQPLAIGLGALNGSGVMHKGGSFDIQGAIKGGATAYAMSELGEYARGAADVPTVDATGNLTTAPPLGATPPPISEATGLPYGSVAGDTLAGTVPPPAPSFASNVMSGNFGAAVDQSGTSLANAGRAIVNAPGNAFEAIKNYNYSGALDNATTGIGNTLSGAKNLAMGDVTSAAAKAASGVTNPALMAGVTGFGVMSLADMDAQRQYLKDQAAAGAISNAQYQQELADIERQADIARKNVAANPLHSSSDLRNVSAGPSLYDREDSGDNLYARNSGTLLYAMGGSINSPDDQTGMATQTPMQNFEHGGIMSMIGNTVPQQTFAAGGMPRFLSGGGDGMSDSIHANINGTQEARLADGEFVVPADVVSHLGNGSSKAGAKQLYSMMDKVREARTGRKSQGKQINPRKFLLA